jgi:hypothetical protein
MLLKVQHILWDMALGMLVQHLQEKLQLEGQLGAL